MKAITDKGTSIEKDHVNGKGSNSVEGGHARTTIQSHPRSYNRTPKPNMPQFLHETVEDQAEHTSQGIPCANYLEEYRALGHEFQAVMSFTNFYHLKLKIKTKTI